MKTRVIICGGRDFRDKELCNESLNKLLQQYDNMEIVSGHSNALSIAETGDTSEAIELLDSLNDFENAALYKSYYEANLKVETGEFHSLLEAREIYLSNSTFLDSKEKAEQIDLLIISDAEALINRRKFEEAICELNTVKGIDRSDELYEQAMIGLNKNNYQQALSYMLSGDLDKAYDLLLHLDLACFEDPEPINSSIELVKKYKDSIWIGAWENENFDFIRYTNVIIKGNTPYIVLTQSNSSTLYVEAEYPQGMFPEIDINLPYDTGKAKLVRPICCSNVVV